MTDTTPSSTLPEPGGFNQLSKLDQVRYVQNLWDKIAASPETVEVPDSHWALLEQRLAAHLDHPENTVAAHDILNRLSTKPRA